MTDYQKYINALRKCANEHENDITFTGNIIVSDLCRDTANLLEELSSSEKPNNSEIPTSSITKNCESCRYYGLHHEKCNYCYKCSLWTEQEPRKGHWISHREHCEMNNLIPSGLGSYFWCSECDCGIDGKNFSRVNYNYCPNCGAKMESEEV